MKLLITTQAIDDRDPVLGFFVRWVQEFAQHCEQVTVVCLRVGPYTLPPHVRVIPLTSRSRLGRLLTLWYLSLRKWREYDAVFVHMNPEYLVGAGLLWRVMRKRIGLWYTHKSVTWKLRIATRYAHRIFTASRASFRLKSSKVRVMGHGIDTSFFSPGSSVRTDDLLSVGRLSPSKRHDLLVRALSHVSGDLLIVGEGREHDALVHLTKELGLESRVHLLGPRTQTELRDLYQSCGIFLHASETGSLDKVVLEALACGLPVITTDRGLVGLPLSVVAPEPKAIAKAIVHRRSHPAISTGLAAYVQKNHSLTLLVPKMVQTLETIR